MQQEKKVVDQIYDLLESLTDDERNEFINHERSNILKDIIGARFTPGYNDTASKKFEIYDIVIEKIDCINAKSLFFLKEVYNQVKCLDLNIMQISKIVKECEKPFIFLWLGENHKFILNGQAIDKTIKTFALNGIQIRIEKNDNSQNLKSLEFLLDLNL